jgi:hypothetical protein
VSTLLFEDEIMLTRLTELLETHNVFVRERKPTELAPIVRNRTAIPRSFVPKDGRGALLLR